MSAHTALEMPALTGQAVTEAHKGICAELGHATHTVEGEAQPHCPRCGAVKAEFSYTVVPVAMVRQGRIGYEVRKMNATTGALIDCLCKYPTKAEAEAFAELLANQ